MNLYLPKISHNREIYTLLSATAITVAFLFVRALGTTFGAALRAMA